MTKVLTVEKAFSDVPTSNILVAVGGVLTENRPVALQRELLRRGAARLRYVSFAAAGYDLDLMIAAGAVAETFVPAVTFDRLGTAPSFRRAAETKTITAHIVDVATIMAGYFAAAEGLPFHPVTAVGGSDVTSVNPLLKSIRSPFNTGSDEESTVYAVAAIVPDLVLIHCQEADVKGNCRVLGSTALAERMLARTGARVIVSCERVVPTEVFEQAPHATTIPGMYVDAVCCIPGGAHPTSSPLYYNSDQQHILKYLSVARAAASGDEDLLDRYLDCYVKKYRTALDYLRRVVDVDGWKGWQSIDVE